MAADAVAEVKARLDILDVVGGYVSLNRSGRGYKALCPFHSENTPSFTVSQERQAWYCFGCSEGGDIFSFIQKMERSDFRGALQLLAERAGVELEERSDPSQRGAARKRRRAFELNTKAQAYFAHVLWETPAGADGRELLVRRGVDTTLGRAFGVGFAPSGGRGEDALVRYLIARAGATVEEIVDAGLAHHSRGGGGRDRFRHRLVFPIRDERGEVLGFGARALGADQPKYLNSPETAVYHKSNAVFGIDLARDSIRDSGTAVIVEGYFDVVAAHAAAVTNVVASSGTALTREQVRLLGRFAQTIVLCFDADDAGAAAASRAVDIVAAEQLAARIVVMPDGFKDPDELVRQAPDAFVLAVTGALPEWQVLLNRALHDGEGGSVEARRSAAERAVALLVRIPEASTRDLYVQQAARRLELSERALLSDLTRAKQEVRRPARVVATAPEAAPGGDDGDAVVATPNPEAWERFIAAAVVARPSLARMVVEELGMGLSELTDPAVRRLIEVALELPDGETLPLHGLGAAERSLASRLLLAPPHELEEAADPASLGTALADAVAFVREANLRNELSAVRRDLRVARDAGRDDEVARLAARLQQLAVAVPRLRRSVDQR